MTRLANVLLLSLAGAVEVAFAASALSPEDFAYGMPIITPGDAAAYRIAIPSEVYQKAVRPDLGDLQVFNARNEPVPFAIEQPVTLPDTPTPGKPLPLFALHDDSPASLDAMRVAIASHEATISVQTRDPGSAPGAISYVLDGQSLNAPVAALQVHWPEGAADYAGKLRVEAGDTLGSWHVVVYAAPIANLHSNGAQLIEDRIEFPLTRANFWRLSWIGVQPPFELVSASAEPAADGDLVERSALVASGSPTKDRPGEFQFDLGARPPVDRINLQLPQLNTVVEAEILSRASPTDPWQRVTQAGFYRLHGAEGELRNGTIAIGITPNRYWLVRIPQPGSALGQGTLSLEAKWRAPDVLILARGIAPYTLAYGSGSAIGAVTPMSALPVALTPLRATFGAPTILGGDSRLQKPSGKLPWKSAILWTVLAISVALLAAMALGLIKELNKTRPPN